MSVLEQPITASNSTTGAGVIDSWHSVASSIEELKTAHDGDRAAVGVELGIGLVSAALDTVAFVMDPFAKVISAGLGWLIEHISFLRWPLDQVAGDPDQIKKIAEGLHKTAEDLRNAAEDMDAALKAKITGWKGQGFDSFSKEMAGHKTHIDDAGHSVDVSGYVVETTMAIIAAVRALIRDMITTVLGDIISTALWALALAPVTFGASIAVGVTKCVATASIQAAAMGAKLAKVAAFASRAGAKLKQLAGLTKSESSATHDIPLTSRPPTPAGNPGTHTGDVPPINSHTGDTPPPSSHSGDAPPPGSHSGDTPPTNTPHSDDTPPANTDNTPDSPQSTHSGEDDPFQTWLAADQHFNGPHSPADNAPGNSGAHQQPANTNTHDESSANTNTHDEPPANTDTHASTTETPPANTNTPPPVQSYLRPQDIQALKNHEKWLNDNWKVGWDKVKFVDNFVKEKFPGAYPAIKAMADAKSIKNWVGVTDKTIVNLDKQLTDIQSQAEAAWQESDEKWRHDHPDPAAEGNAAPAGDVRT